MAYYEGNTVKDRIKKHPLSLNDAIEIAISIAQALAKAHEKGITHRESGAGMTGASALTKPGTTLGTVPYMSPEQARGEKVDHRSDIWSLGVVLYEMVSGRLPFRSEYNEAMVYMIINESPPFAAMCRWSWKEL